MTNLYNELVVDGIWGPITREAFQAQLRYQGRYNGYIDGDIGPVTVTALQEWLRYDASGGSLNVYQYPPYIIDGVAGPATWEALWDILRFWGYQAGGLTSWDGYGPHNTSYRYITELIQNWLNARRVV